MCYYNITRCVVYLALNSGDRVAIKKRKVLDNKVLSTIYHECFARKYFVWVFCVIDFLRNFYFVGFSICNAKRYLLSFRVITSVILFEERKLRYYYIKGIQVRVISEIRDENSILFSATKLYNENASHGLSSHINGRRYVGQPFGAREQYRKCYQ